MTLADQYRQLLREGMRPAFAREMVEYATGRFKGDGYLPAPGERYDPDPQGVWRMSESEYLAFLETQNALPEEANRRAGAGAAAQG